MTNIREQLLAKTAGIRKTSDIADKEVKPSTRTQTAPGLAGALAAAQLRVQELESTGLPSELALTDIEPNPWQPRRKFNEAKMAELAESIREVGLMQPIVVRRVASGYQIVAGERRWRAHKLLDQGTIKAVVMECSDQDMIVLALVENMDRDDLTDYEIAIAIRRSENEFPSRKRLAEALGMSRRGLYQFLAFHSLADFMKKDLDLQPDLLGGNAAEKIATVLSKHGEKAEKAAQQLWPSLVKGELPQGKFVDVLMSLVTRGPSDAPSRERKIDKFFAGKLQAGSITKDVSHFTVKIKAESLSADKEERIRQLIAELYSVTS